jgi:hypothetical protein
MMFTRHHLDGRVSCLGQMAPWRLLHGGREPWASELVRRTRERDRLTFASASFQKLEAALWPAT